MPSASIITGTAEFFSTASAMAAVSWSQPIPQPIKTASHLLSSSSIFLMFCDEILPLLFVISGNRIFSGHDEVTAGYALSGKASFISPAPLFTAAADAMTAAPGIS